MNKIEAYGIVLYEYTNDYVKILLCKSIKSKNKWGCVKGVRFKNEDIKKTACREFLEECSIKVETKYFSQYFEQINEEKNIGIWLLNIKHLKNLNKYFYEDKLLNNFLSWENQKVQFFSLDNLPKIKNKQKKIIVSIKDYFENIGQSH